MMEMTRNAGPYEYAILVDEVAAGSFRCESYGVRVTARASGEAAQIRHITASSRRIGELVERLAGNGVSPVHLRDVVDDWL